MFTRYWTVKKDVDSARLIEAGRRMGEVVRSSNVPLGGLDGTGEPTVEEATGTICFNGVEGEDYEGFTWPPDLVAGIPASDDESSVFDFCKTGRLPYDAVVAACLAIAKDVLGESMTVEADSE